MNQHIKINDAYLDAMSDFVSHNYEASIQKLSSIIDQDEEFVIAWLSKGSANLKLDRAREALADFAKAVEKNPANAKAHHLSGLAYEKLGENEAALAAFDRAIEIDPEYGAARYSRATLHNKMGKAELASDDMEMVAYLTNKNIESLSNETNIWRSRQMNVEDALETELER